MKVQKLKAAIYSIGQGLRGRQLLKNPKGTPATTVRTIEHFSFIESGSLDIVNYYTEYTKDFANPKSPLTKKYLTRTDFAFFDKNKKELKRQKQLELFQYTDPSSEGKYIDKSKGVVPYEVLESRDKEPLNEKVAKVKEEYIDLSMAFLGGFRIKEAVFDKTRAEIAVDKYYEQQQKKANKQFEKDGFWTTLFKNLQQ